MLYQSDSEQAICDLEKAMVEQFGSSPNTATRLAGVGNLLAMALPLRGLALGKVVLDYGSGSEYRDSRSLAG